MNAQQKKNNPNDDPDIPPCDYCQKNWSGNLFCSQCRMVFYCSKECQKAAWKVGGHKQECSQMLQDSEIAAEQVVARLKDKSLSPLDRANEMEWKRLDIAGPYKLALKHGINEAIQQLFQEDIDHLLERHLEDYMMVSYASWVMNTLFRGNRREGRNNMTIGRNTTFSHVDPYRIKKYVFHSEDALETWWEATMVTVTMFLDKRVVIASQRGFDGDALHSHCLRTARDVAAAWSMVFTDPKSSKAILLGDAKEDAPPDKKHIQRARWMLERLGKILPKFWNAAEDLDSGSAVEGHLNQVAGMIQLRMREYNIEFADNKTAIEILKLKGGQKAMYLKMAVPFGKGTIEKGRALTTAEAQNIVHGKPWNAMY